MKLAVLGTSDDILALAGAALAAGHHIIWLGDLRGQDEAEVARLLPGLSASADWESLLDHALVDAVLVGDGMAPAELRAEQLKRLVADIMPVLAVHPLGKSVLVYYELDMARSEVHGLLRHYSPLTGSPAVATFAEWVRIGRGPVGIVHQIVCQRFAADCGRDAVVRHLARDVEVLQTVAGGLKNVSAVGPREAVASYASLQVQMAGPGAATIRWTIVPSSDTAQHAALTLVGELGSATLNLPAGDGQVSINVGGRESSQQTAAFDPPRAAIDAFAAALPANGTEQSAAESTWEAATAAMEIVDTIELSLQKGRTLEVHPQRLTEQLAFRGTMAAFGCGLLLLMFVGLIAAGLLGDLIGVPLKGYWPMALLAVLALFLLLQALPCWVKRRRKPVRNGSELPP